MSALARSNAKQPQLNLEALLAKLSSNRQEVIRPVLENPQDFVLLNVRDMASRLKVGPSTILRIVQLLGFVSYKDFRHYLHELSVANATILDPMRPARNSSPTPEFLQSSAAQLQDNLRAVQTSMNMEQVLDLARRIHRARRILLIGGDMASFLVRYLEYHLMMIGLPVYLATAPGRTTHLARTMDKHDLVIGMTFRRGLRMTIEGMQRAFHNGAHCIGITDSQLSPIVRYSHSYFLVPIASMSYVASYVAPVGLIDLITAAVESLKREKTLARLEEADQEQKRGYRWYQNES